MRGFSLVELSIVLVILGLLTGGILTGQSLIRAAELRSVVQEAQRFTTAAYSFRNKYMAIPGDMMNATRFWGRASLASSCVTHSGADVSANGTCDGDGNGRLTNSAEGLQFWRQLALAGLIEGNYTGIVDSSGNIAGENVPASRLSNAAWYAESLGKFGGDAAANYGATYEREYGNSNLGMGSARAGMHHFDKVLRPEDAWNIDVKLDDGKPAMGKVVAMWWNNACASADSGASSATEFKAHYRLEDSSIQCSLKFVEYF